MPDRRDLFERVEASRLQAGDLVLAEAGDIIPSDGDVARSFR
jgi:high-affinity K+ transport system ATPase subunit B